MADSNLGNNLISALGMGSFDVTSMVNGLAEAERSPKVAALDTKQESTQAKLDAYTSVQEAMTGFKSLLSEIDDLQKLRGRTLTSSDDSVFTATASSSGVMASPGSYQVEVTSLAQSHSIYSGAFSNTTDTVGTGTLTFRFGQTDYDAGSDTYNSFTLDPSREAKTITIDSSNNSLLGIRDAINSEGMGVTASIINDGSGYRLIFKSDDTGSANSLQVSVDDTGDGSDTDSSGLSRFAFNGDATNMAQSSAATNAAATINGISVTSENNTLSGVVDGLTINLNNTSVGTTNTLTVANDSATVKTAITNFVGDYNALMTVFDEYSKYSDGNAGALQSDSLTRSIMSDIKSGVSEAMSTLPSGFQTLADIGISKDRYGVMELDTEKLDEALANNFDVVARLFTKSGGSDNAVSNFVSANQYTEVGSYAVTVTTAGQEATKGGYVGDASAYLIGNAPGISIDNKNDWFKLSLDGVASQGNDAIPGRIHIAQGNYETAEALATEIQNTINADAAFVAAGSSVTVSVDRTEGNPKFVFSSNSTGSTSNLEITGINTNVGSELGITAKAGTAGLDEVKVVVDIQGENEDMPWSVTGTGPYEISSIFGDSRGLVFDTRAAQGTSFTIDYTQGFASKLDTILERVLDKDEALQSRMSNLGDRLEEIEEDRTDLNERIAKMEETWRRQFNALNTLMGQMSSTSSFLENTFKSMNGSD